MGSIIRTQRKLLNFTQEQACVGICSTPYLSKLENNSIRPNDEILMLLCERLDLDLKQFQTVDRTKYNELLDEYYEALLFRREAVIQRKFSEIQEEMESFHFEQKQLFKLYYINDLLRRDLLEKAEGVLGELEQYRDAFSEYQKYHYYKVKAIYHLKHKQLEESLIMFKKAEKLVKEATTFEPDFYYYCAIAYSRTQQYFRSIENLNKALDFYKKYIQIDSITNCHLLLGINYLLLHEYDFAEQQFNITLDVSSTQNKPGMRAKILHNLGYLKYKQGHFQQSIELLKESLNLKGYTKLSLNTLYLLSVVKMKINKNMSEEFNRGKMLAENEGNLEYQYKFKVLELELKGTLTEKENVQFLVKDILPYYKSNCDRDDYRDLISKIANIYEENGSYKNAAYYYKICLTI
ncbi:helix-turn-helix domain-containing protein [Rossellomorea aquimaris]|uniref:helix-turn-helix domain-containing protein n=1 Tax=Rossellomorea aquimaris TaxID=189382 RepID=UPI0037CC1B54